MPAKTSHEYHLKYETDDGRIETRRGTDLEHLRKIAQRWPLDRYRILLVMTTELENQDTPEDKRIDAKDLEKLLALKTKDSS